jgi:hypothetical protein
MAAEFHVQDTGIHLRVIVTDEQGGVVPLNGGNVLSVDIVLGKPDETTITRTATFETDGSDGVVYYDTLTGDLDQDGKWSLQAYVNQNDGVFHSDITTFKVHANLK